MPAKTGITLTLSPSSFIHLGVGTVTGAASDVLISSFVRLVTGILRGVFVAVNTVRNRRLRVRNVIRSLAFKNTRLAQPPTGWPACYSGVLRVIGMPPWAVGHASELCRKGIPSQHVFPMRNRFAMTGVGAASMRTVGRQDTTSLVMAGVVYINSRWNQAVREHPRAAKYAHRAVIGPWLEKAVAVGPDMALPWPAGVGAARLVNFGPETGFGRGLWFCHVPILTQQDGDRQWR